MPRKLGYLSGAPRTSTKPIASLTGGRQHILGTIQGFRENGWEVSTYVLGDKVPESWLESRHEMNKGKSFPMRLAADLLRLGLSVPHIIRALRDIPDCEWTYERYAAFQLFGFFFQRRGVPWILETNDALFDQAKGELKHVSLPWLVRTMEKFAYERCDLLVVISDELKQIIVEHLRIPANKIFVLPNGADVTTFNPETTKRQRLFGDDVFVIGFQGAMYRWAGLDLLVHAVARLRASGRNVAAVLLGDGHERENLERLGSELGISSYVAFPGRVPREQVPEYIAGYDLCYSGQLNWNKRAMYLSPLKLYDYMAMGKPVIASRFTDAVTLTKDGTIGYLFEPENLDSFVSAATAAYDERHRLPELGAAARAEICKHHTWARRVADLIEVAEAHFEQIPSTRRLFGLERSLPR